VESEDSTTINADQEVVSYKCGSGILASKSQLETQPTEVVQMVHTFNYEPSVAGKPVSIFEDDFVTLNDHCEILTQGQSDDKVWYHMRACCISSTAAVTIIRAANQLKHAPASAMFSAVHFLTSELGLRATIAEDSSATTALTFAIDMWRAENANSMSTYFDPIPAAK
jgi:hypothetical protein